MTQHDKSRVAPASRRPWNTPSLVRLSAGEARNGANAVVPDASFSMGS